jgi:hypothetical protein
MRSQVDFPLIWGRAAVMGAILDSLLLGRSSGAIAVLMAVALGIPAGRPVSLVSRVCPND